MKDAKKCGNKIYLVLSLHQSLSQLYEPYNRGEELNRKSLSNKIKKNKFNDSL